MPGIKRTLASEIASPQDFANVYHSVLNEIYIPPDTIFRPGDDNDMPKCHYKLACKFVDIFANVKGLVYHSLMIYMSDVFIKVAGTDDDGNFVMSTVLRKPICRLPQVFDTPPIARCRLRF
jgi:hypothetical protein